MAHSRGKSSHTRKRFEQQLKPSHRFTAAFLHGLAGVVKHTGKSAGFEITDPQLHLKMDLQSVIEGAIDKAKDEYSFAKEDGEFNDSEYRNLIQHREFPKLKDILDGFDAKEAKAAIERLYGGLDNTSLKGATPIYAIKSSSTHRNSSSNAAP